MRVAASVTWIITGSMAEVCASLAAMGNPRCGGGLRITSLRRRFAHHWLRWVTLAAAEVCASLAAMGNPRCGGGLRITGCDELPSLRRRFAHHWLR
ncbi:hypothetical protein NDU88_000260 [Pleurodeles waltl]|uniref:Secreted protein n=1 Tax=Pleurodeles waltl TaxID=8319 RepID=A0AAV7L5W7_PLEWA|nr:hypothetical protein NDU88_000260 [Pleurodeles waltl]